jgi:hypothetical protein
MTNQELEELLKRPTTTIPKAGEALGFKSRNASYTAAKEGRIKTIDLGHLKPVPTSWLRQVLGLGV